MIPQLIVFLKLRGPPSDIETARNKQATTNVFRIMNPSPHPLVHLSNLFINLIDPIVRA